MTITPSKNSSSYNFSLLLSYYSWPQLKALQEQLDEKVQEKVLEMVSIFGHQFVNTMSVDVVMGLPEYSWQEVGIRKWECEIPKVSVEPSKLHNKSAFWIRLNQEGAVGIEPCIFAKIELLDETKSLIARVVQVFYQVVPNELHYKSIPCNPAQRLSNQAAMQYHSFFGEGITREDQLTSLKALLEGEIIKPPINNHPEVHYLRLSKN